MVKIRYCKNGKITIERTTKLDKMLFAYPNEDIATIKKLARRSYSKVERDYINALKRERLA